MKIKYTFSLLLLASSQFILSYANANKGNMMITQAKSNYTFSRDRNFNIKVLGAVFPTISNQYSGKIFTGDAFNIGIMDENDKGTASLSTTLNLNYKLFEMKLVKAFFGINCGYESSNWGNFSAAKGTVDKQKIFNLEINSFRYSGNIESSIDITSNGKFSLFSRISFGIQDSKFKINTIDNNVYSLTDTNTVNSAIYYKNNTCSNINILYTSDKAKPQSLYGTSFFWEASLGAKINNLFFLAVQFDNTPNIIKELNIQNTYIGEYVDACFPGTTISTNNKLLSLSINNSPLSKIKRNGEGYYRIGIQFGIERDV